MPTQGTVTKGMVTKGMATKGVVTRPTVECEHIVAVSNLFADHLLAVEDLGK